MTDSYDLIVIGAGSGGVRAARVAAGYGARVAIVEEDRVGGTCVIRGCVPKKLYVYASRFRDMFDIAPSYGWQVDPSFDWPTLRINKEKEITRLEAAYVAGLESAGAELIRDRAVLTGPNGVHLVGAARDLEARYILLATGAHAFVPHIDGRDLAITSREAFDLEQLPRTILIEGGGFIGVEFATIFAGLGVDTTIVYRGERILRGFDHDLRTMAQTGMEERGIRFIYETTIRQLRRHGRETLATFSDGVEAPYDAVMFATGRRPNVSGYGLDKAGVCVTESGAIQVDAYSRTSVESIYAVGDVTDRLALTPVAIREGQAFAETVFNDNPTAVDHSLVGKAVFGEPEVATIGLTEEEAATHGDIDVYETRFRPMINTLSLKSQRMMIKLVTAGDAGRVMGLHVVGPGAAEMVQIAAVAMGMGAGKADLDRAIAMHPTAGEELVTFRKPTRTYRGGVRQ